MCVCERERERDQTVKKRREAMPEETTSIDYVMEAASGPHFSGLRLDGLRSSPPSSSTSSPAAHRSPVPPSAFSSSSSSSALTDSNAPKQPFVIGKFHFSTLKTRFHFFNFYELNNFLYNSHFFACFYIALRTFSILLFKNKIRSHFSFRS